ncbi:MAG: hypothetical protein E7290_04855 [Lachnospiraceae bacterium]|nr:hypothetical protein [Lachnospiraceae bacterium]
MKKKLIIFIVAILVIVCIVPLPRQVDCKVDNVQVNGWYLDFLLFADRFYGETIIDGNEYKPSDNHFATKLFGDIYMLSVYRYRAETNDVDMRTIYLQSDLKTVYEWD